MRLLLLALGIMVASSSLAGANPEFWRSEGWKTDFSKAEVPLTEIISGGPPRDGIPPIDEPEFIAAADAELAGREPVISVNLGGEARAYPLSVLIWHEIVNDVIAGYPVAVTYCPLCDSAIVFERQVGGQVLRFGTTGKLRHSDLVMWDDATETWWQQFLGKGIVGDYAGVELAMLPSRVEAWDRFRQRFPSGKVLVPTNPGLRPYGINPYAGYDRSAWPFLYRGDIPRDKSAFDRVVKVGDTAWCLGALAERGTLHGPDGLVLTWEPGQATALGVETIAEGEDIGNVMVQRGGEDVVYDVTFTFAFHAFVPEGTIYISCEDRDKPPSPPVRCLE